jgi:hypothetical protein
VSYYCQIYIAGKICLADEDKSSYIAVTKPFNPDMTMMKNLLSCGVALMMIASASCSKDDDQSQSSGQSSVSVSGRVTYLSHIEPMARKACNASNCHNGIGENTISTGRLVAAAHNGLLDARVLSKSTESPCGIIDDESIAMLQAWVSAGTPMK